MPEIAGATETAVIVGAGRVGTALAAMQPNASGVLVRRGEQIPDLPGPIYVCTRNNDLQGVLDATPAHRHADLVFVQNGMLRTWLAERGLEHNTQALLYFAVSSVGAEPVDGGRTVVTGRWAEALQQRLAAADIACEIVTPARFAAEMVEKLLWNCTLGLLCERHACTVGEVVEDHRADLDALTDELAAVCEAALPPLDLPTGLADRLATYSLTIRDYRAAVKEWPWRSGWLIAQERSPLHTAWLQAAGHLAAA